MQLPEHLHLLIPSSTPSIKLETRIYLPSCSYTHTIANANDTKWLSTTFTSTPEEIEDVPGGMKRILGEIGILRLVVAAHPWGRIGGNMLDPVLSVHLVNALIDIDIDPNSKSSTMRTAVVTFNTRGVGVSDGSLPFPGTIGYDALDFEQIERRSVELLGGTVNVIDRVGYSWGCLAASLAPPPTPSSTSTSSPELRLRSILLIAPPISLTSLLSLLSPFSTTFHRSVRNHLKQGVQVTLVHGSNDQFTSVGRFRSFVDGFQAQEEEEGMRRVEIGGADHFFRGETGEELQSVIEQWSEGL